MDKLYLSISVVINLLFWRNIIGGSIGFRYLPHLAIVILILFIFGIIMKHLKNISLDSDIDWRMIGVIINGLTLIIAVLALIFVNTTGGYP